MSTPKNLKTWYESFLPPLASADTPTSSRIIYAYSEAMIGFAAELTEDDLKYMEKKEGFLKAYPDQILPLLTTHTPDFMGLHIGDGLWKKSGMGKGVIIGVLDTGVSPGHPSFNDEGMLGPPSKWKGECNFKKLVCNKKLIGAKSFFRGQDTKVPPKDNNGHGSHTASTAAGNFVKNATVLGSGTGIAVGMAPRAHLAIYQVCGTYGCSQSDVLAGMDAAIGDGVDVLSLSLGGSSNPFYDDVIAIGAYNAVKKNVFISCAGGNAGPSVNTLSNEAPWILTVAAGTMDRKMKAVVKLGDGREFEGESAFQTTDLKASPLVYPGSCSYGLRDVKGKIVICDLSGPRVEMGDTVHNAHGVGMIIANQVTDGYTTLAEAHDLPASHVNYANASAIKSYIKETENATASISFKGTSVGISPAPTVAWFSSRGPSKQTQGILKPDILGPGVNILAAWPFQVGPNSKNHTGATFNVISGTSMSTPHLSGIAALVKSMHPDWSPASIKSAIMTTADIVDNNKKPFLDEKLEPAKYFATGAGHVNPSKAVDPGLIYDINLEEYVGLLCGIGYTNQEVGTITHEKIQCEKEKKLNEAELNYPSIISVAGSGKLDVQRTVTNVGEANAKYTVKIDMPKEVSVIVSPKVLEFSKGVKHVSSFVPIIRRPSSTLNSLKVGEAKPSSPIVPKLRDYSVSLELSTLSCVVRLYVSGRFKASYST
ncbi:hypothetical protein LUZ60_016338 [Juncus effusus]|nr:hypothetical protein LUZ60_016338 [Juncus effusus]